MPCRKKSAKIRHQILVVGKKVKQRKRLRKKSCQHENVFVLFYISKTIGKPKLIYNLVS